MKLLSGAIFTGMLTVAVGGLLALAPGSAQAQYSVYYSSGGNSYRYRPSYPSYYPRYYNRQYDRRFDGDARFDRYDRYNPHRYSKYYGPVRGTTIYGPSGSSFSNQTYGFYPSGRY